MIRQRLRRWSAGALSIVLITVAVTTSAQEASIAQPIATANQVESPAAVRSGDSWYVFWVGDDEAGVHQDARRISGDGLLDETVILPLPPRHPFAQAVIPSVGAMHLLWLDADDTSPDQNRLFTALISTDLTVERGPTALSEAPTLRYSAIGRPDGGYWAAWIGGIEGSLSARGLYVAAVDALGRPRPAQLTIENADHPAFVRNPDGTLWLYWLDHPSGALRRAALDDSGDGVLSRQEILSSGVYLDRGDRIDLLQAAVSDTGDVTIVINLTRSDQRAESWVIEQLGSIWSAPSALYAGSGAHVRHVRMVSPTQAAGVTDAGIITFAIENGAVKRQDVIVPEARPLRPPHIALSDTQQLIVWSQPDAEARFTQWSLLAELP